MTDINQLTGAGSFESADQVPIWDSSNGGTRKVSGSDILSYVQANLQDTTDGFGTQFSAPSATGFSVTVGDGSIWLVLTPVAGYAAGTIVLPATPADGDEFLCNCTQAVTTLTVDGNGNTVTGEPATLAANDFFRLRFEGTTGVWYRVG